jgi:hypothetical protein
MNLLAGTSANHQRVAIVYLIECLHNQRSKLYQIGMGQHEGHARDGMPDNTQSACYLVIHVR